MKYQTVYAKNPKKESVLQKKKLQKIIVIPKSVEIQTGAVRAVEDMVNRQQKLKLSPIAELLSVKKSVFIFGNSLNVKRYLHLM